MWGTGNCDNVFGYLANRIYQIDIMRSLIEVYGWFLPVDYIVIASLISE